MLHLHALRLAEGVDPAEPVLHAGEKHDLPPLFHQISTGKGQAPLLRLPDHGVHIREDAVHPVLPAKAVGLRPELRRGHAKGMNA